MTSARTARLDGARRMVLARWDGHMMGWLPDGAVHDTISLVNYDCISTEFGPSPSTTYFQPECFGRAHQRSRDSRRAGSWHGARRTELPVTRANKQYLHNIPNVGTLARPGKYEHFDIVHHTKKSKKYPKKVRKSRPSKEYMYSIEKRYRGALIIQGSSNYN